MIELETTPTTLPSLPAIPRYRQILKRELPPEYLKADNSHFYLLIPHMLIIAAGLWAMTAFFSWWTAPLLGILIGHSFAGMAFVAHETCHGGSTKNKTWRHFLTGVAFSPFGVGPYLWSQWHNAEHHGHTQHPELDPDRLFTMAEYPKNGVLKFVYKFPKKVRNSIIFAFFTVLFTQHNLTIMKRFLGDPERGAKEKSVILFQFLAPKVFWIGLTAMLGWPVLLMGYCLPLLVGNFVVIAYISTNHFLNPLADESDVLASSLSVTLPRWLGWLDVLHGRFGAHVAHHLFPTAPSRYCRKIEEHVARLWPDMFHIMPFSKALKLLYNTQWVYDENGNRVMDPERNVSQPTLGHGL